MNINLSQQLEKVFLTLCEDAATPRALTASLLWRYGEHEQLLKLQVDPAHYLADPFAAEKLYWDLQVTEFLRKLDIDVGLDLEDECWEAFLADEKANARTNARFSRLINGPILGSEIPQLTLLAEIQRVVRLVLGPPPKGLDQARHGKGGTFGDAGGFTTIPDKMSSRPQVYASSRCLLPTWRASAWARGLMKAYAWKSDPVTVRGNRFGTVSKDALKRRGICSEASLQIYWQLSIGAAMRRRLRRFGIDLDRGQTLHRVRARKASLDDADATIDLSSASNLNAKMAVRAALQRVPDWLAILETLRAPLTRAPKARGTTAKWYYLEMFSSMGNGFTFELETVLFLSIALAVGNLEGYDLKPGRDVLVYGDDIIVPKQIAPAVVRALQWFGHKPNPRKTYVTGHFKESCGADYFLGVPVRAHYQKSDPAEPQAWMALANGLRRTATAEGASLSRWNKMRRTWRVTLNNLPTHIRRLRGPSTLGDTVIHDDRGWVLREYQPSILQVLGLVPIPMKIGWEHWHADVMFAAALYGCPSSGIIPRRDGEDVIQGYRIEWLACLERPVDYVPGTLRA